MAVKTVESLVRGLDVLEVLAANPPSLKLKEVTERVDLPKATTYRILQTLIARNYVHYFKDSAEFRLGPKVMSLGYSSLSELDIVAVAQPYITELSGKIKQNVNLGIVDGSEVVYVIRTKVRSILGINLVVGSRLPAHNTSVGQALLAFMPPDGLEEIVSHISRDRQTAAQIGPDGDILKQRLNQVREQGYASMEDEFVRGLRAIAVPIFNAQGFAEAAINVPVFTQQCSRKEMLEKHLPLVVETAGTISSLRGFHHE